jgi:hypothetical protein
VLVFGLAILLTGCGSSGSSSPGENKVTTVPYPNGSWSAADQRTFIGACESEASGPYCKCALLTVMQHYPNTSQVPEGSDAVRASGETAAANKSLLPNCSGL